MSDSNPMTPGSVRERRLVLLALGGLGVSAVMTQLALMREMLGAFSGNEMVLGVILGNWLLLTGLGAAAGKRAGNLRHPIRWLIIALLLVAMLPLAQVVLLRALRNVVFIRGAMVGVTETVVSSFILLAPYCVVSGWMLTLGCALLREREGIGRVYVADSIGSVAGGALFSFVLVRVFDHIAILCVPAILNLVLAGILSWVFRRNVLLCVAAVATAALVAMMMTFNADAISTQAQFLPRFVVFSANSPYGKLVVTDDSGQVDIIENGVPLISTHNIEQVEETVHYAMAQRPDARRVLLVGGGVSGTAKEILKYGVGEITYVELDPLILDVGKKFLADALADPRIRVVNTDGRLFIKQTRERFDVVIVDMPPPSTSQINRFYTAEFFGEVKRALANGGVVSFALGQYVSYVSPELARLLASAQRTVERSFKNVLVIPGGRVFFLASDGELHADIAARIEQRRISTRLVKRSYLDAMLAPDRMADLRRATTQPAAVNEDFNPVLYYYHLLYWVSQFNTRFNVFAVALGVVLAVYLVRLRPVPLVIFASGFAASALEIVLLLGFQILYGSLYQQLGVIVTMFMAGLAAGAGITNSEGRGPRTEVNPKAEGRSPNLGFRISAFFRSSALDLRPSLPILAFTIAAFATLLPLALKALGGTSLFAVQFVIPLLTFVLAVLVGMEFPLASAAQFDGAAATASRLYTADFVGAFVGALLASTFLIPLLGVTAVCLITAGLNIAAGAAVFLQKARL